MPDDTFDRLRTTLADRYDVESQIGRGGMATVFRARDLKHDRPVAIKVLHPELAATLGSERFLREIQIAAKLNHPHILALHDSGEADGLLYYVMPLVEGESLRDRLNRDKQLPLDDALQIARDVASALDYAHGHNVIHRDIKPENVLLEAGGAVVTDFGIARAISEAGGDRLTETGIAVGTPAYMSPEQATGSGDLDQRSDVYSLACVIYEMLAGEPPFTGPTAEVVLRKHITAEPPSLAANRPDLPGPVATVLQRGLAKPPADRFAAAAEFTDALAHQEPASMPERRPVGRLMLLGVAGVVAVGGSLLALGLWRNASGTGEPAYDRTAIAVLPFQNLSAGGPHAYFAGGLHEELLTQLAKVAALTVIGRTSVSAYAGSGKRLSEIGDELGVGSIVAASVQVVGDRLRVNVQLLDAATEAHLWADGYDRTLDDAFAIQSDVARQVVAAVGAALGASEQQALAEAPTANAEAYRLYLQGQEYARRPGNLRRNLESAQQLYERALGLDSTFALAHAALSEVHGLMSWFRYDTSPERLARMREEAEIALRLAPELPQAHLAMGHSYYFGRRGWQAALDEYRIALQGLPNDAALWATIGYAHRRLGHWEEVLAAFERAAQLDPRDASLFADLGGDTYLLLHRYVDATAAFNRALTLAPDLHSAAVSKGLVYRNWKGELDTLRAVLDRLPPDAELGLLGTARAYRVQLLLWERNADSLLAVLGSTRDAAFEGQMFFLPASLYAAWAHELRGDDGAAYAALDSARVLLDSVLAARPDDLRVHAARGLTLAGLGRRQEALREARWLQQSPEYRQDPYDGPVVAAERARVLAQASEVDGALDEIEQLLAGPGFLSVHTLRLDPRWDPIRDDPRFQALLAKYES
jgi:serine/threonine-protein kinase